MRKPPNRAPGDEPGERHPRIVGGDARRIGAGADRDALLQHARDRRRRFGRTAPVALDEVFALVGHAVLHRDAAAERRDPVDVCVRDRLGVVEEPVQPVERDVAVHALEHVEGAADRLVVGRVQAERPAVLRRGCAPPPRARAPSPAACRAAARGNPRSRPPRTRASRRRRCGGSSHRPAGTSTIPVQRRKSSFSPFGFCVKRL